MWRVLVCLVLGVVTMVGTAWAIALLDHPWMGDSSRVGLFPQTQTYGMVGTSPRWTMVILGPHPGYDTHANAFRVWGIDPDDPLLEAEGVVGTRGQAALKVFVGATPPRWSVLDQERIIHTVAWGWPFRSLVSAHQPGPDGGRAVVGVELPRDWSEHGDITPLMLPTRVLWAGAVGNSIIAAAVWWLLLFGLGATRRAWRTRHGRCTACGYDLAGASVCAECGREWGAGVRRRRGLRLLDEHQVGVDREWPDVGGGSALEFVGELAEVGHEGEDLRSHVLGVLEDVLGLLAFECSGERVGGGSESLAEVDVGLELAADRVALDVCRLRGADGSGEPGLVVECCGLDHGARDADHLAGLDEDLLGVLLEEDVGAALCLGLGEDVVLGEEGLGLVA